MKLHIGAFDRGIDGWLNTDITPHIIVSKIPLCALILYVLGLMSKDRYVQHKSGVFNKLKYVNLTKPLPFPDKVFDAVFSSHVLEHLFFDEVESLIKELHRILKSGGVCRVIVPDLEKIISLYNPEDPRSFIAEIYEVSTRGEVKNSHHCAFTGAFLTKLFSQAGFSSCAILRYKTGLCPNIDKLDNRPDSLFFEAIK